MSTLKQGHVVEVKEFNSKRIFLDFDYGERGEATQTTQKPIMILSYSYWHASWPVYRGPNVGEKVEIVLKSSNSVVFIRPTK